jgi:hypothetical protein
MSRLQILEDEGESRFNTSCETEEMSHYLPSGTIDSDDTIREINNMEHKN